MIGDERLDAVVRAAKHVVEEMELEGMGIGECRWCSLPGVFAGARALGVGDLGLILDVPGNGTEMGRRWV